MFCPAIVQALNLTPHNVDELRSLPVLDNDDVIAQLKTEMPIYVVAAINEPQDEGEVQLQWWKRQSRLPGWQLAAKAAFALLPSSAPAERVFLLLKASTHHLQSGLLEDQLEATLMLQICSTTAATAD